MRPSRDETFMEIAHTVAKRGTCSRAQVGAVIVRDGRIVSIGYNGAPAGQPHCDHYPQSGAMDHDTYDGSCTIAIHAEMNAIIWGARAGVPIDSCTMYATHSTCATCAVAVVASGIKEFVYDGDYRLGRLDILVDSGLKVRKYGDTGSTPDAEGDRSLPSSPSRGGY